jgi:hypothetical protein
MTAQKLDQDLINHACRQLDKWARIKVGEGLSPASAARSAIHQTKPLFPADWRFAVQGDDSDDEVEVWEVDHKLPSPCARIKRAAPGGKLTDNQRDALDYMIRSPNRTATYFPPSLRRVLAKLVDKGFARTEPGDPQQRARYRTYRATEAGKLAYYATMGER